jgi:hypothetical protein
MYVITVHANVLVTVIINVLWGSLRKILMPVNTVCRTVPVNHFISCGKNIFKAII